MIQSILPFKTDTNLWIMSLWYKAPAIMLWIYWQMWVFSSCVSCLSLVHTPGAAQYFVSTVAPVFSGTVRIIITAPRLKPISVAKTTQHRLSASHRKWVDDSGKVPLYWKKNKNKEKTLSLYLLTPTHAAGFLLVRDNRTSKRLVHTAKKWSMCSHQLQCQRLW